MATPGATAPRRTRCSRTHRPDAIVGFPCRPPSPPLYPCLDSGRCACPATSRFRTATPCSPRLPTAARGCTATRPGADCAATLACLEALGVSDRRRPGRTAGRRRSTGSGLRGLRAPAGPLDAANSGTSMRLLVGAARRAPVPTVIGGDASLSRRPMRRVIEPLTRMGATIAAVDGRPPLTIDGAPLHGNCLRAGGAERAGQERRPARRPARGRADRRSSSRRRHGIIRSGPCRRSASASSGDGLSVSVEGGHRLHAMDAAHSRATSRRPSSGWCWPRALLGRTSSSRGSG